MGASQDNVPAPPKDRTTSARKSDCELVVTRTFDAPARRMFAAWTSPEQFRQWWVPKSCGATLLSCEQDVRVGGSYRLEFVFPQAAEPMAFFGSYLEVVPDARLVWSNEENADGAVTTVTFEEKDGQTLLVLSERYPSKEAFDAAAEGTIEAMPETFAQLGEFLAARSAEPQRF